MKHWKQIIGVTAVAACSMGAYAQELTLKVHHFLGPQSPQHAQLLSPWCDKLAKESSGKIKCQIYPAMSMGGTPPQLYDQAKDGVADIIYTAAGYSANRFPRMEVFELPFIMTTAEATGKAAWDYHENYAKDEFADTKLLALVVHGSGNIFTTKKKVEKMEDLRGLKLRAPTRMTSKLLASMGATPVGMPVPAVPDAISKGVIDGAVIPYEVAPAIKMHELVKYTAETDRSYNGLYTTVFVMAMNKAKYEALPAEFKRILDANSGRELSGTFSQGLSASDVQGKEKVVAAGVQINVIPKEELERWKKASSSLNDDWVADVTKKGHDGKKLLQAAQDLIKQHTR